MRITTPQLAALLGRLGVPKERVLKYTEHLLLSLEANEINTPLRLGHFLSQVLHESMFFRFFEEIASGAAYEKRVDLGNVFPGDGVRFKGRGPIQLTGRNNYTQFNKWLHEHGIDVDVVENPELLETKEYGFLAAMWYWTEAEKSNGSRTNLSFVADRGDTVEVVRRITKLINGGLNGFAHRRSIFIDAMKYIRQIDGYKQDQGLIQWGEKSAAPITPIPSLPPDQIETESDDVMDQDASSRDTVWSRINSLLARVKG